MRRPLLAGLLAAALALAGCGPSRAPRANCFSLVAGPGGCALAPLGGAPRGAGGA